MSRGKELAKNTLILTIGKISTQFVQFLLLPLYTALLVPEEFGIVDLFNTYVTLLVPLFNWQFDRGLFRFLLDYRTNVKGQKKVFTTVMVANAFQVVIYLLFFEMAKDYIHSPFKVFLALDVAANIILNTLLQFSRGIGNNGVYAVASFLSATISVVLNVCFIAGLRMGALGMFLAVCISKFATISYLAITQRVWRYFSIESCDWEIFKGVFKYSFPLVPNALSWWVISASNRSVISTALGVAANGIFSVANKFSAVFITFYNVFDMSWTETVSLHIADEDKDEFLTQITNRLFRLFSALCIGIIACMPFVFPLMVNKQYAEAYYQIPILMVAVLFQVVVGLYSAFYVAMKKSVEIAKTSVLAACINLAIDVLFIKQVGLFAASIATLSAYASMALYRYFHVKRYINIKLSKRSVLPTIIIGSFTIAGYYSDNMLFQILILLCVGVYAIIMNRAFIYSLYRMIAKKI